MRTGWPSVGNMPAIAIIGAGPGLGIAVARKFGREGFTVALVARNPDKLSRLVHELAADGVTAKGYLADVRDRAALTVALQDATRDLDAIHVLQYSPVPSVQLLRPVLDTTVDDLAAAAEFSILGPAAAIAEVLPGMIERGQGTVLFVNGSSAATPNPKVGGTSVAFAGESAYAAMLHEVLDAAGVRVRQLIIPGAIGGGDPLYAPEALAGRLWDLHTLPGPFRVTVGSPPQ